MRKKTNYPIIIHSSVFKGNNKKINGHERTSRFCTPKWLSPEASDASKRAPGNPNQADHKFSYVLPPPRPFTLPPLSQTGVTWNNPKKRCVDFSLAPRLPAPRPNPMAPGTPEKKTLTSLFRTLDLPTASCPELPLVAAHMEGAPKIAPCASESSITR